MPKRSSKKPPADPNRAAFAILSQATDDERDKNPAAVALGRLGGIKGGAARAKALSAEQRRAIAKRAAEAKWHKRKT